MQATIAVSPYIIISTIYSGYHILPYITNLTIGDDLVFRTTQQIILTPANGSAGANDVKFTMWQSLGPPEGLSTAFYEALEKSATGAPYTPTTRLVNECGVKANCTFSIFDSLAVCSTCHRISDRIVKIRAPSKPGLKTVDDFLSVHCAEPDDCFTWGLDMDQDVQMESPLFLTNPRGYINSSDAGGHDAGSSYMAGNGRLTADRRETVHFLNSSTTFIVFQLIQVPHTYENGYTKFEDQVPKAHECGLFFCLKRYNSTIRQSRLREDLLQSATWARDEWLPGSLDIIHEPHSGLNNLKEGSDQWAYWNFLHNSTLYSPWTLHDYNSTSGPLDSQGRSTYWGPNRHDLALPLPTGWIPNNFPYHDNFTISFTTILSTISWFLEEFGQSNHDHELGFVISHDKKHGKDKRTFTYNMQWADPSTYLDIESLFDNISKSLSVWLRSVRQEHTEFVNATSTYSVPEITIRTQFLILPVGTIVASCLFVIWTIWDTHRLGLRAWKESSLPILIHGLTASTRERLRAADRVNCVAKLANNMEVKLERDSDGSFELKEVDT